jgi:8-oxo-dGTP diphosphatase
MPRHRAAGVVIHDDKLLVMYRVRDKQEFYVFPGGGIDNGETLEQAVERELLEETSINVKVGILLYEFRLNNGDIHYYYKCEYLNGTPALNLDTNEYKESLLGYNYYKPMWLPVDEVSKTILYPEDAKKALLADLHSGFEHPKHTFNIIAHY